MQHLITDTERPLIDTNQAMVAYVTDRPVGNSTLEVVLLGLFLVTLSGVGLAWVAVLWRHWRQ